MRRVVAVVVLIAAAQAGCEADTGRRGLEYMPDMAASIPYDSFAPNSVTRSGSTLQTPVPGTVARGFLPFPYAPTQDDAERAGRELHNPLPLDPTSSVEGQALYETFCLVCHGRSGDGDGPLVPKIPNPPSYRSEAVRGVTEGRLFHIITYGSGRMPSYAAQLSRTERWQIVRYVQTLQRRGEAAP
jgi:mono/diheme cytochrome c family protein